MADWIKVMPADEIPSDDVLAVTIDGREFAIYGVEGEAFATDVMCTHGDARLCDGFLIGHEIECPFHQGRLHPRLHQHPGMFRGRCHCQGGGIFQHPPNQNQRSDYPALYLKISLHPRSVVYRQYRVQSV